MNVVADGKRLDAAAREDEEEKKKGYLRREKVHRRGQSICELSFPTKFLLKSRISRRTLRERSKKNHSQMKEKEEER